MHPYKSVYRINFDVATELITHRREHLFGKCMLLMAASRFGCGVCRRIVAKRSMCVNDPVWLILVHRPFQGAGFFMRSRLRPPRLPFLREFRGCSAEVATWSSLSPLPLWVSNLN